MMSVTQEDQNELDEKARKAALDELVGSWMDRLQQISIIVRLFILHTNTRILTSPLADHVLCGHGVSANRERAPLSARQ